MYRKDIKGLFVEKCFTLNNFCFSTEIKFTFIRYEII